MRIQSVSISTILPTFTASFLLLSTPVSLKGSGFAVQEQGVSGLGNSYAGGSASAEDASTVYFNPAGMALLEKPTLTAGIHYIRPDAQFQNEGSTTLGQPTIGSNSASTETAIVPNIYYVTELNEKWKYGIGISAPYGLTTEYDGDWVGRYIALKSHLSTINLNPSLSFAPNKKWSFGFGVNAAYLDAELSNAVDFGSVYLSQYANGTIPATPTTSNLAAQISQETGTDTYDGDFAVEGNDLAWGWNLGALYQFNANTRLGFHYRSSIKGDLEGNVDFTVGALAPFFEELFADQGGRVEIELPETASISIYHQTANKWAFMADISHTGWSSFQNLIIEYDSNNLPDTAIPERWEDTKRYSLGANYRLSESLLLRMGAAYDESPVPSDALRSPRIPDEDRKWLSAGLSGKLSERIQWDLAYVHVFVDDPVIDNDSHSAGQHLIGSIDATVDIVSFGISIRH